MSFPKPVRRLDDKQQQRREAAAAWLRCCRAVDQRDSYRCRVCGRRVRKTFELVPERAEHHHLAPRSLAPSLRFDPRNVVLVDAECHGKLTRHELVAVGTQTFEHDGQKYLDADGDLAFQPAS